jgi:hypothetical protein
LQRCFLRHAVKDIHYLLAALLQASDLINAAALGQLAAAEASEAALQAQLSQQLAAFEAAQADKAALAQRMTALQVRGGSATLSARLLPPLQFPVMAMCCIAGLLCMDATACSLAMYVGERVTCMHHTIQLSNHATDIACM